MNIIQWIIAKFTARWTGAGIDDARRWVIFIRYTTLFGLIELILPTYFHGTTVPAPFGIVSLQLAGDSTTAQSIMDSWIPWGPLGELVSQLVDLFYIAAYVTLFVGSVRWIAASVPPAQNGFFIGARPFFLATAVFAGIFDVLEDIGLATMLIISLCHGQLPTIVPAATACCSVLKIACIALTELYLLVGLVKLPDTWNVLSTARLTGASLALAVLFAVVINLGNGLESIRVLAEASKYTPGIDGDTDTSGNFWTDFWTPFWQAWHYGFFHIAASFVMGLLFTMTAWLWSRYLIAKKAAALVGSDGSSWATASLKNASRFVERASPSIILLSLAAACYRATRSDLPTGPSAPAWEQAVIGTMGFAALVAGGAFLLDIRQRFDSLSPAAKAGLKLVTKRIMKLDPRSTARANPKQQIAWLAFFAIVIALYSVVTAGPWNAYFADRLGSVPMLLIGCTFLVTLFSYVALGALSSRLPFSYVLLAAALLYAGLDLGDDHAVRISNTRPTYPTAGGRMMQTSAALQAWLNTRADRASYGTKLRPYPVFIVAAQGGGIRAAYQTAYALATLQQSSPAFAQHTFAISSVSGGSLGAAVFDAMTARFAANAAQSSPAMASINASSNAPITWPSLADTILRKNLLAAPLSQLVTSDTLQALVPFSVPATDRSRSLEYALEWAWLDGASGVPAVGSPAGKATGANAPASAIALFERAHPFFGKPIIGESDPLEQSFYNLFTPKSGTVAPYLFFNSSGVESGNRLVIAPLWPNDPQKPWPTAATICPHCVDYPAMVDTDGIIDYLPCVNGMRLFDAVSSPPQERRTTYGADINLDTAACLSARFPLITASGWIPEDKSMTNTPYDGNTYRVAVKQHYVDGGYFDNSGDTTVLDILKSLKDADCSEAPVVLSGAAENPYYWRPIVITIEYDGVETLPKSLPPCKPISPRPQSSPWDCLSPLMTVFNIYQSHNSESATQLDSSTISLFDNRQSHGNPPYDVQRLPIVFYSEREVVPLAWELSLAARTEIKHEINAPVDLNANKTVGYALQRNTQVVQAVQLLLGHTNLSK